MADVLVRDNPDDSWRVATPFWQGIHSNRAQEIADLYNSREYGKEYKARFEDWETSGAEVIEWQVNYIPRLSLHQVCIGTML